MKQILPPIAPLDALCGDQTIPQGTPCRRTTLFMQVPCDDGVIFYHTLTGEMLLLTEKEAETADSTPSLSEELKRKWFFVPESFDDCKFSDQCRETALLMQPPEEAAGITSFTIFTTTDCNARCFYCYEKGCPRINMTGQTAHDAAAYMLKVSNGKKLKITWFGGEPLFNAAAIDVIIGELRAAGCEFTSSMFSNGYLFDEAMVRKAATKWNLKEAEITLDGTEAVYNRTKAFIYKDGGSAWQHVMNVIDLLQDAGIRVIIRLNVDHANAEDLMSLTDILAARFGKRKNFGVYATFLYADYCRHEFPDSRAALECITALNKKLSGSGLLLQMFALERQLKTGSCMADNDHTRTILPDGHLGKCTYYLEDHFVGSIYSDEIDTAMLNAFREQKQPEKICRDCAGYPLCHFLTLCVAGNSCTDLIHAIRLDGLRRSILETYRTAREKAEKADPGKSVPESEMC